jgi:hypothetical protein
MALIEHKAGGDGPTNLSVIFSRRRLHRFIGFKQDIDGDRSLRRLLGADNAGSE